MSTLFDVSTEKGRAEARAVLQSAVDRSSLREVAEPIGISHATLHDFLREKSPPSEKTLRLIQGWLERQGPIDTADGWQDDMLRIARQVNGERPMTPAEKRRTQRDILVGMIRLGRDEGKDVRKLEAAVRELDAEAEAEAALAPPLPEPPQGVDEAEAERWYLRELDRISRLEEPEWRKMIYRDSAASAYGRVGYVLAERAGVIRAAAMREAEKGNAARVEALQPNRSVERDRLAVKKTTAVVGAVAKTEGRAGRNHK